MTSGRYPQAVSFFCLLVEFSGNVLHQSYCRFADPVPSVFQSHGDDDVVEFAVWQSG